MKKSVLLVIVLSLCSSLWLFGDDVSLHNPQVVTRQSLFNDKIGFKYGASATLGYNLIQMETSNNKELLFHQMQIDQSLFIGYNFNGWIALYVKSSFDVDVVSTNSGLYITKNRLSIYGKVGPRFYMNRWLFVESSFVFGRSMYRTNWNYYSTIGADVLLGFDVLSTKRLTLSLQPIFSYRRTSYSNEFRFGLVYAIEA